MIDLLYEYTEDNLMLEGTYFDSNKKNICILYIHGQAQSILNNPFAYKWGKFFSSNGISFLYGHNRGYDFINCMFDKDGNLIYNGSSFELFKDSLIDINTWVNKIKRLGYKKIILFGHSLGCNKALNYLIKFQSNIDGIIFASAPDMVGITKQEEKDYEVIYNEAINILKEGNNKLLSNLICGTDYMSAETFIDQNTEKSPIDNFPIERNPIIFEQLSQIRIPILSFCGSLEYSTYLKQELLKEKAINCHDYTYKIVNNTNHFYNGKELDIAKMIQEWINNRFNS
ncbi:MAG: alpha/beta fold hydrolase [Bacilli bacterium]|nr:alpha/beta fold hydrolase [Bacilli bacterium]